jgi:hypothetical protein
MHEPEARPRTPSRERPLELTNHPNVAERRRVVAQSECHVRGQPTEVIARDVTHTGVGTSLAAGAGTRPAPASWSAKRKIELSRPAGSHLN